MRGRKPMGADEKTATGNLGRRPINDREPRYDAIDPTTPVELTDSIARAEWNRIAPLLSARGHATTVDRPTLIGYCLKYAQWIKLETAAAMGEFLINGKPNPVINMANKAYVLFLKAAVELGVTPSQRPRVVGNTSGAPAPADEFTEFARSRPTRLASRR